jgi:hypothetical protein
LGETCDDWNWVRLIVFCKLRTILIASCVD